MSANFWLKNYHTRCCCYFHHSHIDTRPLCCHILSKTHGSRYLCRCRRLRLVAQYFLYQLEQTGRKTQGTTWTNCIGLPFAHGIT